MSDPAEKRALSSRRQRPRAPARRAPPVPPRGPPSASVAPTPLRSAPPNTAPPPAVAASCAHPSKAGTPSATAAARRFERRASTAVDPHRRAAWRCVACRCAPPLPNRGDAAAARVNASRPLPSPRRPSRARSQRVARMRRPPGSRDHQRRRRPRPRCTARNGHAGGRRTGSLKPPRSGPRPSSRDQAKSCALRWSRREADPRRHLQAAIDAIEQRVGPSVIAAAPPSEPSPPQTPSRPGRGSRRSAKKVALVAAQLKGRAAAFAPVRDTNRQADVDLPVEAAGETALTQHTSLVSPHAATARVPRQGIRESSGQDDSGDTMTTIGAARITTGDARARRRRDRATSRRTGVTSGLIMSVIESEKVLITPSIATTIESEMVRPRSVMTTIEPWTIARIALHHDRDRARHGSITLDREHGWPDPRHDSLDPEPGRLDRGQDPRDREPARGGSVSDRPGQQNLVGPKLAPRSRAITGIVR